MPVGFIKLSFLMFNVWHISLQFLKNPKLNIEYQHNLKKVTKVYALFIHMDHKYALYSIFPV